MRKTEAWKRYILYLVFIVLGTLYGDGGEVLGTGDRFRIHIKENQYGAFVMRGPVALWIELRKFKVLCVEKKGFLDYN